MNETEQMEALAELVGQLLEETDPRHQERLLVESLHRGGWAQAVALWHRTEDGRWIQVLARGSDDLLPPRGQVEGIFEGDLPGDLPLGRRVLYAPRNDGVLGLALGGIAGDLEIEDLLDGMFGVFITMTGDGTELTRGPNVHLAGDYGNELLDLLQGPHPNQDNGGSGPLGEANG